MAQSIFGLSLQQHNLFVENKHLRGKMPNDDRKWDLK